MRHSMSARSCGSVGGMRYPQSVAAEPWPKTIGQALPGTAVPAGSGPGGSESDEPHLRLMLAVLEDALNIIREPARHVRAGRRRLVRETIDWVLSDDVAWPFSFRNVCEALNIDERRLRNRLAPWLELPVPPFAQGWAEIAAEQLGSEPKIPA